MGLDIRFAYRRFASLLGRGAAISLLIAACCSDAFAADSDFLSGYYKKTYDNENIAENYKGYKYYKWVKVNGNLTLQEVISPTNGEAFDFKISYLKSYDFLNDDTNITHYFKWDYSVDGHTILKEVAVTDEEADVIHAGRSWKRLVKGKYTDNVLHNNEGGNYFGQTGKDDSGNQSNTGGAMMLSGNQRGIDINSAHFFYNGLNIDNQTVRGGAVYLANSSVKVNNFLNNFFGNYAITNDGNAYGGAIYITSSASIGEINGDFIGNYTRSTKNEARGGAIYMDTAGEAIGNVNGNFVGNYAVGLFGRGGAIYIDNNGGQMKDITGNFIGNYVVATEENSGNGKGGAICVEGQNSKVGNITADFIGNYAKSLQGRDILGGAIHLNSVKEKQIPNEMGNITGDFIGNYAWTTGKANGGGIRVQEAILGNVTGNFVGNYAYGEKSAYGGMIRNSGTIGEVRGLFYKNYVEAKLDKAPKTSDDPTLIPTKAQGGAYYNAIRLEAQGVYVGTGNIYADFVENYALNWLGKAEGGAIYNADSHIDRIESEFIGNYAISKQYNARGGAIAHTITSDDVDDDDNYDENGKDVKGKSDGTAGNAKEATIKTIGKQISEGVYENTLFQKNWVQGRVAEGGAIYVSAKAQMDDIYADFIGNHAESKLIDDTGDLIPSAALKARMRQAGGGAIFVGNGGSIENIYGKFTKNYVESTISQVTTRGGAIYVSEGAKVSDIGSTENPARFTGNYTKSDVTGGGAILVHEGARTEDIYANFIENHAENTSDKIIEGDLSEEVLSKRTDIPMARGGALMVRDKGKVGNITGDFIGNYVTGAGRVRGGAILVTSNGSIGLIDGTFRKNFANGLQAELTYGGAIRFDGSVSYKLDATFIENWTNGSGGALSVTKDGYIVEVSGDFAGNKAGIMGGAVHNVGTIGLRGKVVLQDGETILEEDFSNAKTTDIYGRLETEDDETNGYNNKKRHEYDGSIIGGFVNANFIDNKIDSVAYGVKGRGKGGAIYTNSDLFITASGQKEDGTYHESVFSGNIVRYTDDTDDKIKEIQSAIYVDNHEARVDGEGNPIPVTIYLMAVDGASIRFEDRIRGVETDDSERFVLRMRGYTDKIEVDSSKTTIPTTPGTVTLNNLVMDSYAIMDDVTLKLGIPEIVEGGDYDKSKEYVSDFAPSLPEYVSPYKQSYVLARSHFSARSGLVDLTADEGALTEYIFGSMIAYGRSYNYSDYGSENGGIEDVYTGKNERYASFAVDIVLDKDFNKNTGDVKDGWADIITVFEDKNEDKGVQSEGRITLTGLSIKSGSDYGLLYNGVDTKLEKEYKFRIQILNLVVKGEDGNYWGPDEYKDNGYWAPIDATESNAPIQLDNDFRHIKWEKTIMFSDEILAADITLDTTKTFHDSILLVGWRDNLAAWAEISDELPEDHRWEWSEGTDPVENKKKIFYLTAYDEQLQPNANRKDPTHYLTRNIDYNDPGKSNTQADTNPVIWGEDLTIWGLGVGSNRNKLYLQQHNLLSQIGNEKFKDQRVQLRNFILMGVMNQTMNNGAYLTLDSMQMEKSLTVNNNRNMVIQGIMDVDFKITTAKTAKTITGAGSDAERGSLTFDDESYITKGRTISTIKNTIEHQDITLTEANNSKKLPAPSELTPSAFADANFTTVVNLPTTKENGTTQTDAFKNFTDNALTMDGGKFNLGNMYTHQLSLNTFTMKSGAVYVNHSTVDLAKKEMGRIIAGDGNAVYQGGTIWLNGMRIISDGAYRVTHVQFVDTDMGDAVRDNNINGSKMFGPIHEYAVTYNDNTQVDEKEEAGRNGYYTFVYTGRVNPEIQAGAAAELTDANQILQVYDYSFEHADLYSSTIANTRLTGRTAYAIVTPVKGYKDAPAEPAPCATNFAALKGGMWVRPYVSYEKLPLNNGPRVSANMYGALVGADSDLQELRYGWGAVYTLYGTYLGNSLRYDTVRIHENGGGAGFTGTFYRGNFYTALTASANTLSGHTRTSYGTEDYDTLMFGVASRTGYTYIPRNCKYALQPTLQVSYTHVDMKDYTNAAGVRVDSKPLQTLQVHPYLKALMHTNSGWDPYMTAGYVYNAMGKTNFRADGYRLPKLSINPYAEYSIGVQKTWKDRFTLYGQATGRNGGRNGAEASVGLRIAW